MRHALLLILLTSVAFSQTIFSGPLSGGPIPPADCVPDPGGATGLCFASDGVHVSIAGAPFGAALPSAPTISIGSTQTLPAGQQATVVNGGTPTAIVLDFGIPTGATGAQGVPGPAGIVAGSKISGTMQCGGDPTGTIPKGFTASCIFTVSGIQ